MEFYILNTSLRSRGRRHSADLAFAGQKARPGQRLYLDREQVQAEYDHIFQLLEGGLIELRATATGSPVSLEGLKPKESKPQARPQPVSEPKLEPAPMRAPARLDDGPLSVSELLSMAGSTDSEATSTRLESAVPTKVIDLRPTEEPKAEISKVGKKSRKPQSFEE